MKFAIAFVAALASLVTLSSAQGTVSDLTCKGGRFRIKFNPSLINTAQDVDVTFELPSRCVINPDSETRTIVKVQVTGKSSGSCDSGSASTAAKATGFPSFSGDAIVEALEVSTDIDPETGKETITEKKLFTNKGKVNGKITTGGIELEGKVEEGEGKGKIIRIQSKGTADGEKKKESEKCTSKGGYKWIGGSVDLISVTDK
ncbi:hypothetical protein GQ42DRAFT_154838 [Ramicandelaber brevisporus]|nr:hypothetical protein GQ42DRAFT_154838 [Ramicandelaber brevisporus]